ncbi:MAG: hypothetical protein ACI8WB_006084 [Phenylobacterium sp.]|jgi:hypothetical protein
MKNHLKRSLIVVLFVSLNVQAVRNSPPECVKYDKKIKLLRQKMRQGYTIAKGEYYKYKLSQWQDRRVLCEEAVKLKKKRRLQPSKKQPNKKPYKPKAAQQK